MKKIQKIIYLRISYNYVLRADVLKRAKNELNCSNLAYYMLSQRENILKVLFYCVQWRGKMISLDEFVNDFKLGRVIISRHDQYNLSQIHKLLKNAIRNFRIDW